MRDIRLGVYVAGNPHYNRDEIRWMMDWVIDNPKRFSLTYDWLNEMEGPAKESVSLEQDAEARKKSALCDLEGVYGCDVLVLFDSPQGWGMYTELGAALASGCHVIVVHPPYLQVFYYLDKVHVVNDFWGAQLALCDLQEINEISAIGET